MKAAAIVILFATSAVTSRAADVYSVNAHVIAAGADARATGGCYALQAVVGEPIAGFASGGSFALASGFFAAVPLATDTIFNNGFEDCTP